MFQNLSYEIYSGKATALMASHAFMTTSIEGVENTMTIGWGTVGIIWNVPMFVALVRQSRFTKELVDKSGEFTVTFPDFSLAGKEIKDALTFCGTKSGRDFKEGKIPAAGLSTKPGQILKTPILAVPGLNLECKVVYKQTMLPEPVSGLVELDENLHTKYYPNSDYHTIYYGQIVAAYEIGQ